MSHSTQIHFADHKTASFHRIMCLSRTLLVPLYSAYRVSVSASFPFTLLSLSFLSHPRFSISLPLSIYLSTSPSHTHSRKTLREYHPSAPDACCHPISSISTQHHRIFPSCAQQPPPLKGLRRVDDPSRGRPGLPSRSLHAASEQGDSQQRLEACPPQLPYGQAQPQQSYGRVCARLFRACARLIRVCARLIRSLVPLFRESASRSTLRPM